MADPLEGLAQLLAQRGLVNYSNTATTGDCFLDWMPDAPDSAVSITGYGGSEGDARSALDFQSIQVRVRDTVPHAGRVRCRAIYDALHGYHGPLPDGSAVESFIGIQSGPVWIGPDARGRSEHVCNFRAAIGRPEAEAAGRE